MKSSEAAVSSASRGAAPRPRIETLSNIAFERLRTDVVTGNFAPGEKLHVEQLGHRYGISLSPLREALSRLAETGLVVAEQQRGYRVASVSIDEYRDIIETRLLLEKEALVRSLKLGDLEWETAVVASFHRLSRIHAAVDTARPETLQEWTKLNREFHAAIISACQSKWMFRFCLTLYDQTGRYHHRTRLNGTLPLEQSGREHKALFRAVMNRDAKQAATILEAHVRSAATRVERGEPTLRG
ncbi:MAG TPA: FCD domain-containing protein [Alphaproteobacteria bacterium]|jgi:DNA-binding GntR family transcriptional regulator|nr:FCD domain-containing protein [Alphaproteobacteria bacterium]